jgi:O-methyltransferase involved in polyketide biosynthesis
VTDDRPATQGEPEPEERDHTAGTAIDTTVPHSARIWNYWLGGKDNYAVDRAAGDEYTKVFPGIVDVARASRHFLTRTIRYLAGEAGIRQFLDVGTGLPTVDNTHQVAQRIAPEARVVYVDNDPLVLVHARALLTSTPEGVTAYIDADLRDADKIMTEAAETLDFTKPIALILSGIMGHVADTDEARSIVHNLMDRLPSGSYLSLNDGTSVIAEEFDQAQQGYNETGALPYALRTPKEIASFFEGLELVEPGIVSCPRWRPEATPFGPPTDVDAFGGVGRKP